MASDYDSPTTPRRRLYGKEMPSLRQRVKYFPGAVHYGNTSSPPMRLGDPVGRMRTSRRVTIELDAESHAVSTLPNNTVRSQYHSDFKTAVAKDKE
ncbi:hypothetical protein JRQ81_009619 [Phrynocephalus forsythii]|uniref:Uncharacterized protein n=1 Tax=Phrynocephalus forsythii TaxID=171643 RepID=A0A9Q0XC36_9SAUR|nr:hypothetical protein JRQ81_009619 [Phrynocephalus forsythii]